MLSRLLQDSRPAIRYRALESIAAIDPKVGYLGADQAIATAVEMTKLTNSPLVLLVGANAELRLAAAGTLTEAVAANSLQAGSAREALLALSETNPAEMVIVVDRVRDMSLGELIQRLKRTSQGKSIPMAVLVPELTQHELNICAEHRITTGLLTQQPEQIKTIVDQLAGQLDVRPITSQERADLSRVATGFLQRISTDRNSYSFYSLDNWQRQLVSTAAAIPAGAGVELLAGVGNQESQWRLVTSVASATADNSSRTQAARAFGKSVRQFGVQLTQRDIRVAYDLYNQLGPKDPALAKSLAYVLDVIEAQSGHRSWPDAM
jgi:CheY-like chemotaxis protein